MLPLRPVKLVAPITCRSKDFSRESIATLLNSLVSLNLCSSSFLGGSSSSLNLPEASAVDREVLGLAREYGPLFLTRRTTLFSKPPYLECDSVDDWTSLADDVQVAFTLLADIQEGKPARHIAVSNGVAWLDFQASGKGFEGVSVLYVDTPKEATATRLLARLFTLGMARASYSRKGVALSSGQIVALSVPRDLFSAIWQLVEAAVTEAPVLSHLRLRRCCECGKWAFEKGDPAASTPTPMSRRKSDGAWYEVSCKKRLDKRKERAAVATV